MRERTSPSNGNKTATAAAQADTRARTRAEITIATIAALFDGLVRIMAEQHRHELALFDRKLQFLGDNGVKIESEAHVTVNLDL